MSTSNGFILNVYELDLTPVGERILELPIRIGRSSLNDVCVAHRLVSEFHARIEELDERLCVRDLNSKNGVLVESVGHDGAARIAPQVLVDLEPYGYEFLLSPLLRVRLRPATGWQSPSRRHSQALGSVLGNAVWIGNGASVLPEEHPTDGFASQGPGALQRAAAQERASAAPARAPLVPPAPARAGGARPPARAGTPPSALPSAAPSAPGALDHHAEPSLAYPIPLSRVRAAADTRAGAPSAPSSAWGAPTSGSLAPPPLPAAHPAPLPAFGADPLSTRTLVSPPSSPRSSTRVESGVSPSVVPVLAHAAWELEQGTSSAVLPAGAASAGTLPPAGTLPAGALPAGALPPSSLPPAGTLPAGALPPGSLPPGSLQRARSAEPSGSSLEALALRGLRELAASLLPNQPVESAADVAHLITKLHDALEMFCRCFIPVREACSRFIPTEELERAAAERCQHRSTSYMATERALEPRAVAAALLDWRNPDEDAPRAVEHILADLMLHHLALSQAAIEGTNGLLETLSPARVEADRARAPGVLTRLGLPGARERALWETFVDRHAELEAAGHSFRELFGEQFSRAYAAHFPLPGSGPSI